MMLLKEFSVARFRVKGDVDEKGPNEQSSELLVVKLAAMDPFE